MKFFYCLPLLIVLLTSHAYAACTAPPAEAGVMIFNTDHKVMQYCNGDIWVAMGGGGGSGSGAAAPSGAVIAFDTPACPDGWSPYTASSGRFIRGRCISGQTCNDPDGARVAGHVQGDTLGNHNHTGTTNSAGAHTHTVERRGGNGSTQTVDMANWATSNWASASDVLRTASAGAHTHTLTINDAGGDETRPKNVALLYCRKD